MNLIYVLLVLALMICPMQAAFAGPSSRPAFSDPVVLENQYLRATIDRARGGVLRSLIYKPARQELTEEFHANASWVGGLAEDRIAGQHYPNGEINLATYSGQPRTTDDGQSLEISYTSHSEANGGLVFTKSYRLNQGETRLWIDWTIRNTRQKPATLTPWVHNIVHRRFAQTILPSASGIRVINPGADYFVDPVRDWIGALDPDTGLFTYFSVQFNQVARYYYSFWNGYHTVEWVYRPITLKPGESWSAHYCLGVVEGMDHVAYASPEIVSGYQWDKGRLRLKLATTHALTDVQAAAVLDGKQLWQQTLNFKPAQSVNADVPMPALPDAARLRIQLARHGAPFSPGAAVNSPDKQIMLDLRAGAGPETVALTPWAAESFYQKRQPATQPAVRRGTAGAISLWSAPPMTKVFREDTLVDTDRPIQPLVAARGERVATQLVLHNDAGKAQAVQIQVTPLSRQSDPARQFPVRGVYRVGYIQTHTPSHLLRDNLLAAYPDPLFPDAQFDVAPGKNQPVWIILSVPRDVPAGVYHAQVSVAVGQKTIHVPLSLEVLDFTLPKKATLRTDLGCWTIRSDTLLPDVGYKGGRQAFFELCQQNYLEHRLTPREKSIPFMNGTPAEIEQALRHYRDQGINSLSLPKALMNQPERLKMITGILRDLHMIDMAFVYAFDEAPRNKYPRIKDFCDRLHAIAPKVKFLGTIYADDPSLLYGSVGIWVRSISDAPWIIQRQKAGDEFWTSNVPNVYLEANLGDLRKQFWKLKAAGYTGFLFWNCVAGYGRDNPWKDIYVAGTNGNGHLLYPSAQGPLNSIRWEIITQGVQDYDYLSLLQSSIAQLRQTNPQAVKPAVAAMDRMQAVIKANGPQAAKQIAEARIAIGRQIVALRKLQAAPVQK